MLTNWRQIELARIKDTILAIFSFVVLYLFVTVGPMLNVSILPVVVLFISGVILYVQEIETG